VIQDAETSAPDAALPLDDAPDKAQPARRPSEWLVPAALAVVMLLQLLVSVRQLSQTSDEALHLYAGYRQWHCGDFAFNLETPPLAKLVAALPLRMMAVRDPFPSPCSPPAGGEFQLGRQFVYAGNADRVLFAGRAAIAMFTLATLLLAWFWSRAMFGRTAASIAAILLAFEPNLLAHGALVTTDVALAFGVLAVIAAIWFSSRRRTWSRVALAGVAIGAAMTTKFSGVVLLPIAAALLTLEVLRTRGRPGALSHFKSGIVSAIMAGIVALVFLWSAYGFRAGLRSATDLQSAGPRIPAVLLKTHLVPQPFAAGLGRVMQQTDTGQPMFLFGRLYPSGRWFYFPAVLLVKLTLATLLLTVLAIVTPWWQGRGHDALYILLPAVIFLFFAARSRMDIGVRHVLPVIVLLAIAAGAAAASSMQKHGWAVWAVAALLIFHVATSLHAFPNYISYANEAWGGPSRAYRQLSDSNTDWGQALKQAGRYATTSQTPCWILSPYPIPLAYNGVLCRDLRVEPSARIQGRVLVSSTAWSGVLAHEFGYDPGEPFRSRTPSATIGGSALLVYDGDFDLHTNLSLVYMTTAQVLLSRGRATEALDYAQQASQLRPDAGTPHYLACGAELAAGAPDIAAHECAEAVRLLNRNPEFNASLLAAVRDFMRRKGVQ
jgi:hypothetical protein